MVGSVTTVADAGSIKIPFTYGAQESAHGNANKANISNTATLVKAGIGYVGEYCSTGSGTGTVTIYDSATTGGAGASNEIYTSPATTTAGACVVLELPYQNGLVVVTGGSTTIVSIAYR
jgi:hypothetical protein